MMPLRDAILDADDLRREAVPTPEWGEADGQLFVRELTAGELEELAGADDAGSISRCRVVELCTVREDGKQVFSEGDAERLARKSNAVIHRLFDAAKALSGLDDEDAAKNSPETDGDGLPSDSA